MSKRTFKTIIILLGLLMVLATTSDVSYPLPVFAQTTPPYLPDFRLPYSRNVTVYWTGGPHVFNMWRPEEQLATVLPGLGSGLDFAIPEDQSFDVRAMADGIVEYAGCDGSFGCEVAIRHSDVEDDPTASVLIYGHLKEGSISPFILKGVYVYQGKFIGKAGNTNAINDPEMPVHLHIELRDGRPCTYTNVCVNNSSPCTRKNLCMSEGLDWGNPIGWDDLVPLVDDYRISGYYKIDGDQAAETAYNYDGSAIKGPDFRTMTNFRYYDQPGDYPRKNITARVHTLFTCSNDSVTCENNSNPSTQFAGHGCFGSCQSLSTNSLVSITAQSSWGGTLSSSNLPSDLSLDNSPPTASWTAPANGSTIQARTVTLRANASDDSGSINYVQFSANYGAGLQNIYSDYSAPYEFTWDMCTAGVPDGPIELDLQAYDNSNNHFVYSEHYANYVIYKNYNCGTTAPPPPAGQVKLYNQANFGGSPFWTGGVGDYGSINPLQFTYSIEMLSGWSVKTYAGYNFTGEERCWSGSEEKLSDHGWTAETKSVRIYSTNVCPAPTPSGATWQGKFWRTGTCYDDHSQCTDSNTTYQTNYGVPGMVNGRNYIIKEDWGTNSPGGSTPNDEWTGYFRGTINFAPGNYVFYSTNDDGLKFKIPGYGGEYSTSRDNREENQQMCNGDGQSYYLSGNKTIEAYLIERGGDATIQIWYDNNTDACVAPVLFWPGNNSSITDNTPTFDWESKAWGPQYTIAIDGIEYTTSSSDFTPAASLAYGTHSWQVRARNPYGGVDSPWSATWQFTIRPPAPTNIYASDGTYADKVQITWNAVSGATSYEVYRATSYGGSKVKLATVGSTSYGDTSATTSTTYYYWIKTCTASACSDYSNYDTGWRNIAPPTNVQASDGTYTDKVRVTWNTSLSAVSYDVYRHTGNDSSLATQIAWAISGTSYDDANATPGQVYYYWVKANNNYNTSGFSASNSGYRGLTPDAYITIGGVWTVNSASSSAPTKNQFASGEPVWIKLKVNNKTLATVNSVWNTWVTRPDGGTDNVEVNAPFGIPAGVWMIYSGPYTAPSAPGVYVYHTRVTWNNGQNQVQEAIAFEVTSPNNGSSDNILINEIDVGDPDWVELYNAGRQPVSLTGWHWVTYAADGTIDQDYIIPAFVLQPGAYVVLHEVDGTNAARDLYFDANTSVWVNDGNAAAALTTGNGTGVDFVRWGSATASPPSGTGWIGSNPVGPSSGKTLARVTTTDTDTKEDWVAQNSTPGVSNSASGKVYLPIIVKSR